MIPRKSSLQKHCYEVIGTTFGLLMLLACHLNAATPLMQVSTELHSLSVNRQNPGNFSAEMAMKFRWNPKELPDFHFDEFVFENNVGEVYQQVTLLPSRSSDGFVGALLLIRGTFESSNDFAAYPFNRSRFCIVARKLRQDFQLVDGRDSGVGISQNVKPLSYNFTVNGTGFLKGNYVSVWSSNKDFDKVQGIPSISYFIDTEHKPQRSLLMIFLPLLLIWGITYSSQWWKDESASSRAIMASLFSVITLTFSAINLQPDVSYCTAMNWAFAAYYLNLLVLGTLTVLAFRANKRGDTATFRLWRRMGRVFGVILLIGSTLAIAEWVHHKRNLPAQPWLFHLSS